MTFLSRWSGLSPYFLWIGLPVFNTLNQVAMKLTAGVVVHESFGMQWFVEAASAPYIWLSFACEIINFGIWLAILKRHTLSQAFPLTAISYASLMLTSWLGFHEPIMLRQVIGVVIIMAGIALMGFSAEEGDAKSSDAEAKA